MPSSGRNRLTHERARAWLAERLDGPLQPGREDALAAHLASCVSCREVDAEYRANRAAIRLLAAPVPPRDLSARTLAALQVEVGRVRPPRAAPVPRLRGARRGNGVAFGSLLTVALVAVVGALLVGPTVQIPGPNVGATPFAIAPVDLAFVGIQGDVVRLYRARLDRACPPGNISCADFGPEADQVVGLPQTAAVSGLAFDPAGRRAAIAARPGTGTTTTYYVVDLGSGAPASVAPTSPFGSPAAAAGAGSTAATAPSSAGAAPQHSASPAAKERATPLAQKKTVASTPRPSTAEHATKSPGTAADATRRPAASASPTASPAAATSVPAVSSVLPAGGAGAGPASSSALGGPAGITTLPPVLAQPILQDVIPTGAAPAWSPDGTTLAFSAMPADGSMGPDIYIWHPGDEWAIPITTDHASSFASWAGSRIVGSTYTIEPGNPAALVPESFVLDPLTGDRRTLAGTGLWLPSVDPTAQYAVGWSGTLRLVGQVPAPDQGQLVFAQWNTLDPYALPAPVAPVATPTPTPSPTVAPASHRARAERTAPVSSPALESTPVAVGPGSSTATGSSGAAAGGLPAAGGLGAGAATPVPIDASPAPGAQQFEDWAIGWSPDGSAFAVWEGQSVGAQTGTLWLHAVDGATEQLATGDLLLGPVAACRGFSMGLDRLVWATPADLRGYSQLRVVVWGSFGRGEMRSQELDQQEIVPAF